MPGCPAKPLKAGLIVGEVEIAQLHHRIDRASDGNAELFVAQIQPTLDGEVISAATGQLVNFGLHGTTADVQSGDGVGDGERESEVSPFGMRRHPHQPLRFHFQMRRMERQPNPHRRRRSQPWHFQHLRHFYADGCLDDPMGKAPLG